MTIIQYTCKLIQKHWTLKLKKDKTPAEVDELNWFDYKLNLVRNAQRRCG